MVDGCEISISWKLDPTFASRVAGVLNETEAEIRRPIRIISGYRSPAKQQALINEGALAAPINISNHTICPARAVDVSLGAFPTGFMKTILGRHIQMAGLRWGGGSVLDCDGIPKDWQHMDEGPRSGEVWVPRPLPDCPPGTVIGELQRARVLRT